MPSLNPHLLHTEETYLFAKIAQKRKRCRLDVINLGVGDVSKPPIASCIDALRKSVEEMTERSTLPGYPPNQGYQFLREKIALHEYANRFSPEEIFIGAGAKNGAADLLDLFAKGSRVGIPNPSYPVYLGASRIAGMQVLFLPCLEENNFAPTPPNEPCSLIYLCSPNNPTGHSLCKKALESWVAYAHNHGSLLFYDAAYEGFITSGNPRSIYAIPGAEKVAIEARSFSKKGGFTNLRCSYMVIPKECRVEGIALGQLWERRCQFKFGGVPYPVQKAAESLYSSRGRKELMLQIQEYQAQAVYLRKGLLERGFSIVGGSDAPYVWCKIPPNLSSWEFFDLLLEKTGVLCIPGVGFGSYGEGFVRFSAFPEIPLLEKALTNIEREMFCAI
ncbi:MAG: LL-diaminopimelate aminotransferase [Chlamydiota bacterium]